MRELKIFIIVVILTGVTYWGIEPYAHNVMHPHVGAADYDFGAEDINQAKSVVEARQKALDATKALNNEKKVAGAQKDLEEAQKSLENYTAFWNDIKAAPARCPPAWPRPARSDPPLRVRPGSAAATQYSPTMPASAPPTA